MATNFKERPWRSAAYRKYIASLPCAICGSPSAAHHENLEGHGTMGGKSGDDRCLPLCPKHHYYRHNGNSGRAIWHTWGKDPEQIIAQLFANWKGKNSENVPNGI